MEQIPPHYLPGIGGGDFLDVGKELANLLIDVGGFRSDDSMLDIGCGLGRVALHLAQHLKPDGRYEGLDVVEEIVAWNQAQITLHFPHLTFTYLDIASTSYNPEGTVDPTEVQLPYADESFDLVCATSLFTHLLDEACGHYLDESARVLRPGGTLFATFLLLNERSLPAAEAGTSDVPLPHTWTHGRLANQEKPEDAVAYREDRILAALDRNGFVGREIFYGNWPGRHDGLTYQDLVVAKKG
jgi:SAM-dependent methyltransferase